MYLYNNNLCYPQSAKDASASGIVYCSYLVDITGEIRDAKIVRGIHVDCDQQVVKLISMMPNGRPGQMYSTGPKKVRLTMPVKFGSSMH